MTRAVGSAGRLSRRAVLAAGAAALVMVPPAWAQEAGRIYRLGVVYPGPSSLLIDGLRGAGFVEGRNLSIVAEWNVTPDRADSATAAVVKAGPDVIYTAGPALIRAVQRATKTIPILAFSADMVGQGFVASLAHPGGNTTGVSMLVPELDGKRQDILIDLLPGVGRLAALVDPGVTDPARLPVLAEAARARGVTLSIHRAGRAEDVVPAIEAARDAGAQALNFLSSPIFDQNRKQIIEHAAMVRLPAIYYFAEIAEEGGLVAYGSRATSMIRQQLAPMMVKLLRRVKPADIPVEQPTEFELVINLKTANALGLTIPTALMLRADKVIE